MDLAYRCRIAVTLIDLESGSKVKDGYAYRFRKGRHEAVGRP
jgi:hypothetical protein